MRGRGGEGGREREGEGEGERKRERGVGREREGGRVIHRLISLSPSPYQHFNLHAGTSPYNYEKESSELRTSWED